MKVVRINQLVDTEREVEFTGGISFRAVIAKDNMGFAVCRTVIPKGGPYTWQYPHHLEACYCIKGRAILTDLTSGITHYITPDVIYLLDNHDRHAFEAIEDTVLISIFNPPLIGNETHSKDGTYPKPA